MFFLLGDFSVVLRGGIFFFSPLNWKKKNKKTTKLSDELFIPQGITPHYFPASGVLICLFKLTSAEATKTLTPKRLVTPYTAFKAHFILHGLLVFFYLRCGTYFVGRFTYYGNLIISVPSVSPYWSARPNPFWTIIFPLSWSFITIEESDAVQKQQMTKISRLHSCFHSGSTFLVYISVLSSFCFLSSQDCLPYSLDNSSNSGLQGTIFLGFISFTQLLLETTVHPKLSHRIYILRLQNMCFCFCTKINHRSGAPERYIFSLFRILRKWFLGGGGGDGRWSPYPSVLHTQGMEDQYNRNTPVNVPRSLPRRFFKK